ncbi:SGNH/GDSL hydrolase family protein [Bdellovibrio sp. HCB-110]|uniref:SGNH/GDSL hydrolase family protein n=1 Tax=Bdellovibrio sp. HCB-110 TaxID=3391182 RepID=UPI0039B5B2A5
MKNLSIPHPFKRFSVLILILIALLPFQNCGGLHTLDPAIATGETSNPDKTPGNSTTPDGGSSTPVNSKTCGGLKKFIYTQTNAIPLQCSSGSSDVVLFDVQVPAEGRAFARASFNIFNFAPAGDPLAGSHSWSGFASTGDTSFPQRIGGGAGQTICPGQSLQSQQILSYGLLNANSKSVRMQLRQYTTLNCTHGSLIIQPGAQLEVWVEDPNCPGSSLMTASYFRDVRALSGVETPFALTTNTQDVVSTNMTLSEAKTALIYGQMEASMPTTTNRCGSQYETAVAAIGLNGGYQNASTSGWPVSGGETHIALYPAASLSLSAGSHRIHLAAAVNQSANSGRAQAGLDHSADTIVGVILNPSSATLSGNVQLGRPHKILTLGDSITLGYEDTSAAAMNGANGGYRYFLYHHLANRGFNVNFVGSFEAGPSDLPQKANEGHSGWKINDIMTGVQQYGWVRNTKPDVILLHIGTNDFFQNYDLQNIPGRLSALLDQLHTDAPNAKILVAKIVPMPLYQNYNAYVADYNNSIGLIVAQKQSLGRAVYSVDMNSALSNAVNSPDFCADQAHPNRQGYAKMADVWLTALVQLLF